MVWGTTLRTCTGTTLSKLSGVPLRNTFDIESEKRLRIVIMTDFLFLLTPRFAKMRLERIEKLGVEMIEILPQVVQIIVFKIEDAKGHNLFQTIGISSLSDSESRWIWICFLDINYAGLYGLLRALSCSK